MSNIESIIKVSDPKLGIFELHVEDIKAPIWHGKTELGLLSIYLAVKKGESIIPCYGMIYVISTEGDTEAHDVGFAMFQMFTPPAKAVLIMLEAIKETQLAKAVQAKNKAISSGHASLH